jgi:hypothetical protein
MVASRWAMSRYPNLTGMLHACACVRACRPMAGGNNIATYSGDATHHLYLANNVYRQAYGNDRGETTPFLRHLYIKCIILPRQARDKHRENSKKNGVF